MGASVIFLPRRVLLCQGVVFEEPVDAAGEVSFGGADGFWFGAALAEASGDVVVGFGSSLELGDDGGVDDTVEGAVSPSVESVALLAS